MDDAPSLKAAHHAAAGHFKCDCFAEFGMQHWPRPIFLALQCAILRALTSRYGNLKSAIVPALCCRTLHKREWTLPTGSPPLMASAITMSS
jgi:hypothetical protein